jgi:excisionase family DNA binding protein
MLRLNPQTIRNWIDAGTLPHVRLGQRRVRIWRSDFLALIGGVRRRPSIHDDAAKDDLGWRDRATSDPGVVDSDPDRVVPRAHVREGLLIALGWRRRVPARGHSDRAKPFVGFGQQDGQPCLRCAFRGVCCHSWPHRWHRHQSACRVWSPIVAGSLRLGGLRVGCRSRARSGYKAAN